MDSHRLRRLAYSAGGVALAALAAGRLVADLRTGRRWRSLGATVANPDDRFDPGDVADLPEPARRYLRHAIEPGTPLYRSADLVQSGAFRLGDRWTPIAATERITPGEGFVWRASVRALPLVSLRGADHYVDGRGGQRFAMWGLLPVVRSAGPAIDRSAAGRLAAESVFVPTALLPRFGVEWTAVDDRRVRATVPARGCREALTLAVDEDGSLASISADRYRGDGSGSLPFRVTVESSGRLEGMAVPTAFRVAWDEGDGYEPFLRVTESTATFR